MFSAFRRFSALGVIWPLAELGGSFIVTSPTTLTILNNATTGTSVGTASVVGGTGTYTFSLTDPSGQFAINSATGQITTITALTIGTYPVTINASNGLGDNPTLHTTIQVISSAYVPTYYLYGF